MIETPYLLFLGDAPDALAAKVAQGIRDWRPEAAVAQLRLPGCRADMGLPEMTVAEAAAAGVRTVVVGVANRGGVIAPAWIEVLEAPLAAENIPYRGVFKQGDIVFSILDAAEEFDCDEIAMPAPQPGLAQLFSRAIAAEVRRQRGDIPVVMVDSEGLPH